MSNRKALHRGDGLRITLDSREQVCYWMETLGASDVELAAAIQEVGDSAILVAKYVHEQQKR